MATKRKLEETSTSDLNVAILQYFNKSGLKDSAKALTKEAKLQAKDAATAPNLEEIYNKYKPATPAADSNKKAKVESDSDSSDSSDSDSSDSDSDESEKKPAAPVTKAAPAKKEESDSDSDSDSSDSESSDSDSDDDKMKVEKAAPVKAAPAKKVESDSDSDSDSSDSSSSSSSSDSSSDEEEEVKAPVKTPAKKEPVAAVAPQTPATPSAGVFKIYVKGLPWTASDAEVRDFFKGCGKVTECELPLDGDGRSSGTAYVKFADKNALDAAMALDGQTWPGTSRWLKILESNDKGNPKSFGGPAGERPENCDTVFVGNLPWDVTEEQMKELFASAGEISNVRFATGEDGSFRGFGHVQFYNGEDTVAAVKLTGTPLNGRGVRVDYAPPRNRESFGGGAPKSPGGRGGRGEGRGGRGDFGRGRGRGDSTTPNKRSGGIVAGASGKKMTFDE